MGTILKEGLDISLFDEVTTYTPLSMLCRLLLKTLNIFDFILKKLLYSFLNFISLNNVILSFLLGVGPSMQ